MNKASRTKKLWLSLGLLVTMAMVLSACGSAETAEPNGEPAATDAPAATEPVLIFYAIFQRRIIAGITTTGMAGQ